MLMNAANKVLVQIYKVVGLFVLTAILAGLASFFVLNIFFLFDTSWLAPVILSPSHPKVVELRAQVAQQTSHREKLEAERLELRAALRHTERSLKLHERHSGLQKRVVLAEAQTATEQAAELRVVEKRYAGVSRHLARSSGDYAKLASSLLDAHQGSRMIDRESYTRGRYLLSQVKMGNTSAKERQLEISWSVKSLDARADSFAAVAAGNHEGIRTLDALNASSEIDQAQLELAALEDRKSNLEIQLTMLNGSIARYDSLLADIEDTPWLRAVDEKITIAFVPYDNLKNVAEGDTLFGCWMELVGCREVGKVAKILDGEFSAKHPLDNRDVRGQMVELDLRDQAAAQKNTLFARHRPLWVL
jgi:hypothetical protein